MDVSFEEFRASWLEPITAGNPTTVQLGQHFANKIVGQWLDIDDESLDVTYCDGSGDGGIDIAVLERAGPVSTENEPEGDIWYLVQSKYGSAFAGTGTLFAEGQKLIETLDGKRTNLSSLASSMLEKLTNFRASATDHDQILLVYATVDPLTPEPQRGPALLLPCGQGADVSARIFLRTCCELACRLEMASGHFGELRPASSPSLRGQGADTSARIFRVV
jgi:hypothetical protein